MTQTPSTAASRPSRRPARVWVFWLLVVAVLAWGAWRYVVATEPPIQGCSQTSNPFCHDSAAGALSSYAMVWVVPTLLVGALLWRFLLRRMDAVHAAVVVALGLALTLVVWPMNLIGLFLALG